MRFFRRITSFLLPHKCSFCRKPVHYTNNTFICPDCMASIDFIKGSRCIKCAAPQEATALPVCNTCRTYKHSFSGSFTPLIYKDSVRHAILSMKFYEKENFCHSFAFLITNRILEEGYPSIDFITYIPLSSESYKHRGFNQSELIARACGKILSLPVIDTLYRVDGTPRQSSLSFHKRRSNAKKSFKAKDIKLCGTALLIDDIYTTGATLSHGASLLLNQGCDKVYISAVAINPKK